MVDTKAFQVLHIEVAKEFLLRCLISKHPVIKLEGKEFCTKVAFKILFTTSIVEYLLGREITQKFLHVISCTLTCQELTRRDIKEGHTKAGLAKMDSCQEVILLVIQHIIAHGHTWGHKFRNTSLYKLLSEFWILQLIADSHSLSCTNQFWQIGIKCMMRKASHLITLGSSTIITMGQGDTQDLCSSDGVFAIGFIKVATPEQHYCVRMFRF